jgi:predicted permease
MGTDLRQALRGMLASPGFTIVAVAVLALGIGVNTAVFSMLATVLLRGATGIAAPGQLVVFSRDKGEFGFHGFSYPDYCDYRDLNKAFSGLLAYANTDFSLNQGDEPERIKGAVVSNNYFAVLGARAFFGPESRHTAVVSYSLWQRRFRGDPALAGKTIRLNGRPFTVVGIAPEGFRGTELASPLDVWVPIAAEARVEAWSDPRARRDAFLVVVGRLKPGGRIEQAEAEIAMIARQLEMAYPNAYSKETKSTRVTLERQVAVDPWTSEVAGGILLVLLVASGFVLLIACVNVANLLLARASGRRREIAIRLALGAGRPRLVRRLLTESVSLSLAGGALGLLLSLWIARLLPLAARDLAFIEPHTDTRVFAFSLLVSIVTGVAFGLVPALQSSRPNLASDLKEGIGVTPGRSRLRNLLVVSEVCLSLVSLIVAGLLVRSLENVRSVDKGFVSDNVLLMSIDPERQGYDESRRRAVYHDLFNRLNRIPGIVAASMAEKSPVGGNMFTGKFLPEGLAPLPENFFEVHDNVIAPRYFDTLRIPMLSGRDFTERDTEGAPGVVIVNEALARQRWPGENPLGKRVRHSRMGLGPLLEVVGVVGNARHLGLDKSPEPYLYLPLFQYVEGRVGLHIRTAAGATDMAAPVRRELREMDRDLPVFGVESLNQRIREELSIQWSLAALVSAFGSLALVLAMVGLYGVTAYVVGQRTREIGLRMALGAGRGDVMALIVGQSMKLVLGGLAAGVLCALALSRILESVLYGLIAPSDPATYATVSLLLVLVSLVAAYIPARRAARVDPMTALRQE